MRASDADRERAVEFLRAHAGEGRLTVDELGDRVGSALGARTIGDLDDLVYDLPPLPRTPGKAETRRRPALPAAWGWARFAVVALVLVASAGAFTGRMLVVPWLWIAVLLVVRSARRSRLARYHDHPHRHGPDGSYGPVPGDPGALPYYGAPYRGLVAPPSTPTAVEWRPPEADGRG